MKNGHIWLIYFLVVLIITLCHALNQNELKIEEKISKEEKDVFKPDPKIPMAQDPRFNKMLPRVPINSEVPTIKTSFTESTKQPTTTKKSSTETTSKLDESNDDYYYDEYNEDYYDSDDINDDTNENSTHSLSTEKVQSALPKTKEPKKINEDKLKPIKANDKNTFEDEKSTTSKSSSSSASVIKHVEETVDDNLDDDDDDDDDDEDDDDIDIDDESEDSDGLDDVDSESTTDEDHYTDDYYEIDSTKKVACPRNCICDKSVNYGIVATCSRLDPTIQKFGADITDLQILNVPVEIPINLSPRFFEKIGLKQVASITIVNSKIDNIHPSAFENLDQLYSVNITNSNLNMIHPDTFARNKRLRLLSLSGNDLNAMQQKASPFAEYMLKSGSLEELDVSHCNLKQLLKTAFNKLENIVFINLADNELKTLPIGIFDMVETIEELDLSSNLIQELPKNIFNKTSLSILNLSFNKLQNNLEFITSDLQKIDLSSNKMTAINNGMFKKASGLTSLKLKDNSIRRVLPAAFFELRNLRYLDLSLNLLEQLPSELFFGTHSLEVIKLNDNAHLKRLPLEGFETAYSELNVKSLDLSNCDISELGDNTFSKMTKLTTLNLSWNNLNNLGKGIFSYLSRLVNLDLSNNILDELNDLIFLHNRKLKKISIAGNQLRKISAKVFLPTKELTTLDMSDCNLKTVWAESSLKISSKNAFRNLLMLNVSHNEIEHIYKDDFELFGNIRVLDISQNPLHCDEEFKYLMKWLSKQKVHSASGYKEYDRLSEPKKFDQLVSKKVDEHPWNDFARKICQHESVKSNKTKAEIVDSLSKNSNEDISNVQNSENNDSINDKSSSGSSSSSGIGSRFDSHIIDEKEKEIISHIEDSYEDEEVDDDDKINDQEYILAKRKHSISIQLNEFKDLRENGLFAEEINVIKGTGDKIIDLGDDDEIILERRPNTLYSQYKFLMPILIIVFSMMALLLLIGKIVSLIMKRRGERYRQALLATKNSIVYQKLSEDISSSVPSTPKVHKYSPINPV